MAGRSRSTGVTYAKGLGAHAPSDIRYALNGACSVFTAAVGIDDEMGRPARVVFQVWTDGVKQYDSGVMTGRWPPTSLNVNIAGAKELALIITDGGNGNGADHGDWADASHHLLDRRRRRLLEQPHMDVHDQRMGTGREGPQQRGRRKHRWRADQLNGSTYAKGLGAHAPSNIRYALNGACGVLTAAVGVDDEMTAGSRGVPGVDRRRQAV